MRELASNTRRQVREPIRKLKNRSDTLPHKDRYGLWWLR